MSVRTSDSPSIAAKILLVDDNRHGLSARKAVLQELGYSITVSSDPIDAAAIIASTAFDLIITDYKLPHMSGVDLIAKIREMHPATPVILISGFVDTLGLTEENTGSDAVIQKSANEVHQLVRAVARLLRRKTPRKPAASVTRAPAAKAKSKGVS
ncbi:MAG: response regulator [Bryobacterales bacterium]|nr:response regulator [Bryobacterales bacterium]